MTKQERLKPEAQIPSGALIGRYVVLGFIARGGMGEVYAAHDPTLGRRLAIKLLRAGSSGGASADEGRTRLLREAQAIAQLSHPNVVIVHDVGTFGDRVFVAMEFIEGTTLNFWLQVQKRSWRDILKVFVAAGRGLQHAHDAGLVHRDFKPENVMVRVDGQVRVTDFGLVRYVDVGPEAAAADGAPVPRDDEEPRLEPDAASTRVTAGSSAARGSAATHAKLTETGVMLGTPAYMSPEQFSGSLTDARSDQFSFCIALYEALFGQRPFAGTTVAALATNVLGGQVIPPPERNPLPIVIWQALRRGLAVDPAERYPSMNELLDDLSRDPEARRRRSSTGATSVSGAELAGLLETLLGRPVRAKQVEAQAPLGRGEVAVFAGDDGVAGALLHFDRHASAGIAGALTSVPPEVIDEVTRVGTLPQALLDSLREVANVLTSVVRGVCGGLLIIRDVRSYPGSVPPLVVAALVSPPLAAAFEVTIAGYPGGRVTVVGLGPAIAPITHESKRTLVRAMIVDDSTAMRLVIGRSLRRLGVLELVEATNGDEGLKRLREGAAVDAAFIDWSMPTMDGLTFIRAVRSERRFDRLRLVMLTTEGDPARMEAAKAAGADEYLVKPISDQELRQRLAGIGLETTS